MLIYIEGTPMWDHINQLKILREQLKAMGDDISETSHALRMLRLLPPSWDGVCQVLRASQPTISKVKDRLMAEEEARQTALTFANSGSATALQAAMQDSSKFQAMVSTQFGSVLLHPNAIQQQNKPKKNQQRKSKLKNPDLLCSNPNCGKKGHTIEKC
jgi:hypothetical protein